MLAKIHRAATAALALAACLAIAAPAHAATPAPTYGPLQEVIVVCGDCTFDALTAAPLAARTGAPIILVERNKLSRENTDLLRSVRTSRAVIVGGPSAVSERVVEQIRAATVAGRVRRIGGADRYETSRLVAKDIATGRYDFTTPPAPPPSTATLTGPPPSQPVPPEPVPTTSGPLPPVPTTSPAAPIPTTPEPAPSSSTP